MFHVSQKLVGILCVFFLFFSVQRALNANELPSVMDLQRAHIEANGGLANIQALISLIASGEIQDAGGNEYKFNVYRKRPNMMRIQIDRGEGSLETVFNGSNAFTVFTRPGRDDEVINLDPEKLDRLRSDSAMDGPFFQLRSRPEWLKVVAEVEVDGYAAYEIEIMEEADFFYDRIWLGKEHFQEIKLSRSVKGGDGINTMVEAIYFSDFEQVRGVWLAKKIRCELDDRVTQTLHIERIQANAGVFNSLFERPEN